MNGEFFLPLWNRPVLQYLRVWNLKLNLLNRCVVILSLVCVRMIFSLSRYQHLALKAIHQVSTRPLRSAWWKEQEISCGWIASSQHWETNKIWAKTTIGFVNNVLFRMVLRNFRMYTYQTHSLKLLSKRITHAPLRKSAINGTRLFSVWSQECSRFQKQFLVLAMNEQKRIFDASFWNRR